MIDKAWERWERIVNERLALEGTAASGATWKDKGDGATRDNYSEPWPLIADAKTTQKGSFSVKAKFVEDMYRTAKQNGKTFVMPVKFLQEEKQPAWAVVPFEDYAYLVEEYRKSAPDFTKEERALVQAISKQLKDEELVEVIQGLLDKMAES